MVPIYVLYSFIFGIIRIYSLVTLNRQGWMTRGHSNPRPPTIAQKWAQSAKDGLITAGLISALFVGVIAYSQIIS